MGGPRHCPVEMLTVYLTAPSCSHSWAAEEWEHCSKSCGSSGYQLRTVRCLQPLHDGTNRSVHSKYCLGERPESRRPCNRVPCPAQWKTGPWNEVSHSLVCSVWIEKPPTMLEGLGKINTLREHLRLRMDVFFPVSGPAASLRSSPPYKLLPVCGPFWQVLLWL